MRIMTAGAAAALLVASAFGVMALPSSHPVTPATGATLVQTPQPSATAPKAKKSSTRKSSAHHRKGHKATMHRASHRYKTAKNAPKRASAKTMHKGAQKVQRPS